MAKAMNQQTTLGSCTAMRHHGMMVVALRNALLTTYQSCACVGLLKVQPRWLKGCYRCRWSKGPYPGVVPVAEGMVPLPVAEASLPVTAGEGVVPLPVADGVVPLLVAEEVAPPLPLSGSMFSAALAAAAHCVLTTAMPPGAPLVLMVTEEGRGA